MNSTALGARSERPTGSRDTQPVLFLSLSRPWFNGNRRFLGSNRRNELYAFLSKEPEV